MGHTNDRGVKAEIGEILLRATPGLTRRINVRRRAPDPDRCHRPMSPVAGFVETLLSREAR